MGLTFRPKVTMFSSDKVINHTQRSQDTLYNSEQSKDIGKNNVQMFKFVNHKYVCYILVLQL